jgi:signal transduction histidine kinase
VHQINLEGSPHEATVFHAFFDRAHTPLLIVDENSRVVESNAVATEMLGLPTHGRVDIDLLDGFWRVSAAAVLRLIEGVRRQLPVAPVMARTTFDRLVEVSGFLIEERDPAMIGLIITDRSSIDDAQRRLKDQEERYRSLFEWAPVAMREEDFTAVGVWLDRLRSEGVTDLGSYMEDHPADAQRAIMSIRTTRVNAATVDLLKAPSALAILRGFRDEELTPQVLAVFKAQFVTLWEGRTDHQADYLGVNFLGQPFECRLRWKVPRSTSGSDLSRVAVSLLDLTQVRATQRRLERLVEDKDRFIASVSHELRTPLSAVLGLSEELSTRWERFEEEETKELIGLVASQSADLALLVEDLLVAANLEAGRISINPETIGLGVVAAGAISDCMRTYPDLDPIRISGQLTMAAADPVRVRQIIRNLITNAVRYGGDSVSIEIGVGKRPFLKVRDNGNGVPLEHREEIFVPYFQSAGERRVLGSLGLGLAISRELARRMDGDLRYAYEDGYSIFHLELPPA